MSETTDTTLAANGAATPEASASTPGFVKEIDTYLAQVFDELTICDKSYGKVSTFFNGQANRVLENRDYESLSKEEQSLVDVYLAAALAIDGASAMVKSIKETMALDKVKRLHRKVAENRYESLERMIDRAIRNHSEAAMVLMHDAVHPYKMSELRATFRETADVLEMELCQYRDARFRLDMLLWLKDEFEAWLEDRLYSDTPMPTMGQSSVAAIYILKGSAHAVMEGSLPPVSQEQRKEDMKNFGKELVSSLTVTDKDFISAFEILAMIDFQLGAVLEHVWLDKDPLEGIVSWDDEVSDDFDEDQLPCNRLYATAYLDATPGGLVRETLSNSGLVAESLDTLQAFLDMKSDYGNGNARALLMNGGLMAALMLIPIWSLDWAWYWRLVLSVVALVLLMWLYIGPVSRRIRLRFLNKYGKMSANYEHMVATQAGMIVPKSKIRTMEKSRNGCLVGLVVGAILGSFFIPPIGTIVGAICGAIVGRGWGDENDDHGEGWQSIKICSPVKQWIMAVVLACVIGFEIYTLFIM